MYYFDGLKGKSKTLMKLKGQAGTSLARTCLAAMDAKGEACLRSPVWAHAGQGWGLTQNGLQTFWWEGREAPGALNMQIKNVDDNIIRKSPGTVLAANSPILLADRGWWVYRRKGWGWENRDQKYWSCRDSNLRHVSAPASSRNSVSWLILRNTQTDRRAFHSDTCSAPQLQTPHSTWEANLTCLLGLPQAPFLPPPPITDTSEHISSVFSLPPQSLLVCPDPSEPENRKK